MPQAVGVMASPSGHWKPYEVIEDFPITFDFKETCSNGINAFQDVSIDMQHDLRTIDFRTLGDYVPLT